MEISDEKLAELGITREEWNVLYNAWVVKSIYDEILGINLASDNQYAERIS